MQELRLAFRRLMSRPGAAIASVATLACGIGAAAATWSLLSSVLLRPLPIADAGQWFVVGTRTTAESGTATVRSAFVYTVFPQIRDAGAFQDVIATWTTIEQLLMSRGGAPSRAAAAFATHDFFARLGIALPLGRGFRPEDDRRGAAPVAILTDRFWRQSFDASLAVIGQTVTLSGRPVTIVGVAAPGFRGLDLAAAPDLYLPLHTIADLGSTSMNYFAEASHDSSPTAGLKIIGRVRDGDPVSQVVARLSALDTSPRARVKPQIEVTPLNVAALGEAARASMRRFSQLLAGTVVLLLAIACGTVALLLLVRTEARRAEFATCLALGASVARLTRGIVVEAAVLAMTGGLLAIPVSLWLFAGMRTYQLPGNVNIEFLELALDRQAALAVLLGTVMAVLLIASVAGAWAFSARLAGAAVLRAGMSGSVTRQRTRASLVIAQVAVSLVLLSGATLLIRSLQAALDLNPRVRMEQLVTGSLSLSQHGYDPVRAGVFFDELRSRLSGHPGIASVAYSVEQGGMGPQGKLIVDGEARSFPSIVKFSAVDATYFSTMGMPVVDGRDFSGQDTTNAPRVTIVSESFARRLANGASPIGHAITMPSHEVGKPADIVTVGGVVPDVVANVTLLEPLAMYFPFEQQRPSAGRSVAIRASMDALVVQRDLLVTIKDLDPAVVPAPFLTLSERIARQMGPQQLGLAVLGTLGAIALLLTVLGTYVLAESMATLRTREIGIRGALGATRRQLSALMLMETTRLVGSGVVFGLGLAWFGARAIRGFLFRVEPLDPLTLSGVAAVILLLSIVVALTCIIHECA